MSKRQLPFTNGTESVNKPCEIPKLANKRNINKIQHKFVHQIESTSTNYVVHDAGQIHPELCTDTDMTSSSNVIISKIISDQAYATSVHKRPKQSITTHSKPTIFRHVHNVKSDGHLLHTNHHDLPTLQQVNYSTNTITLSQKNRHLPLPHHNNSSSRESDAILNNFESPTRNSSANCSSSAHSVITQERRKRSRNNSPVVHNISGDVTITQSTNDVPEHYLGPMNISCIHCGAHHFAGEKVVGKGTSFNDCCSHGKVKLTPLPDPPPIIKQLFNGTNEMSNHFYDRIRQYNNSFSFASFNANLVNFNHRRPGPYCFKIQGQVYYQINTALYAADNESPSFGQLFIIDPDEAINHRLNSNSNLNAEVLEAIENAMRVNNSFVQSYQMMKEEIQAMRVQNNGEEPQLQLTFAVNKELDRRRYNSQRANEIAVVFSTTADGEIPESYVTIRNVRTKQLTFVSSMNPNVEPWTYPLFYPHGDRGWDKDMTILDGTRRITRNAYFKYRMAIREDPNYFLMGRRLFQQWVVDNFVKMEKDRMTFIRLNQKELRVDTYDGLREHLERRAESTNSRVGKVFVLPSSYVGSPRNMAQTYQDAMTIVRKFGKPDLFITMTCNPKWTEITENLLDGQTASDRPDLVARAFELKKDELIRIITKDKLFGEVQAYVYVIEYQKRGLPHVHLLLTLARNSKITTPELVDKYISAEIPDPTENPRLHEIIRNNMVHGPCGDWCFDDKNKCSKKFPKAFNDRTTMNEDGYPEYKRRDTGISHSRRDGFVFNNQHVVPHNKWLLLRLNCHINVEVVSSIKAVKYMYKYVYKGHDAAAVVIQDSNEDQGIFDHDEIRNYIETRYVCPPEACARIFNFHIQGKSHAITRLPVHLQGQQTVVVDNIGDENGIRSAMEKQTMLNEYFCLNERDPEAKQMRYSEIPTNYVWKKNNGNFTWQKRQRLFKTIGRMYSVSPTQTELFHLRLLLISVKGATSYEDLRTVDGVTHDTYVNTCLALGLIENDDEWKNAMNEAEVWMMPRQLRQLFVRILLYCNPVKPHELWEEFKDSMAQDYSRTMSIIQAHRKAYININTLLIQEKSCLANFPSMPNIPETVDNEDDDMVPEEHRTIGVEQYEKLNAQQRHIVDVIVEKVTNENNDGDRCFFIDGPGGSGKTFIYTTLYHLLRSHKKEVCNMAFTGIAATLLPHGKTVHRTFKLPIALYKDSSQTITAQSEEANYLRSVQLFIWDEAPMAPRHALELVDRNLRDIMNNNKPFGDKLMLLGGDFRQLLPVKRFATRCELVDLSIKFSNLWENFTKYALTRNMRTLPEEAEFAEFLLSVGDGSINITDCDLCLPTHCLANPDVDIAEDMYGDIIRRKEFEKLTKWAILSARNIDVDDINKRVVELLDVSTEKIYTSINSLKDCDNGEIAEVVLPEYLETLNPPNLPPHELKLRINTVVMLIRNLSINEGLCNGTRLQILELKNHLLKCKILTGDKAGEIVFINRITLYSDDSYPFPFGRRQFPIKLAFAMTINKSQGQTFEKIGIDLRRDVFNHGQLYVALSRVRSWESLKIYLGAQRESNVVKNHVFTELYA